MKLRILKILMVVLFLGVGFLMIPPALADEDEDDPPGRVARLSYMDGAVSLAPTGSGRTRTHAPSCRSARRPFVAPITPDSRSWISPTKSSRSSSSKERYR